MNSVDGDMDNILIATFPFIGRFRLSAIVKKVTNKQEMRIEYLAEDGTVISNQSIQCIHTAITTTTLEEIQAIPSDTNHEEYFYGVKSSEELNSKELSTREANKIILSPEEHFFALSSWVQGIAESGMDFLKNLEILNRYPEQYRIINDLFRFMVFSDISFAETYLNFIERECRIDGKPHIPSLIASLTPLQQLFNSFPQIEAMIESMDFPSEVDFAILSYDLLKKKYHEHPEYEKFMFKYKKYGMARDPESVKFASFRTLFSENDPYLHEAIASNPIAISVPEYRLLFKSPRNEARGIIARTIEAVKFPEYKNLITDWSSLVRSMVAENTEAPLVYPEFGRLFKDAEWYVEKIALSNPNAANLPEFFEIIKECALNPNSKYRDERYNIFYRSDRSESFKEKIKDLPYVVTKEEFSHEFIVAEIVTPAIHTEKISYFKIPPEFIKNRDVLIGIEYQIHVLIPLIGNYKYKRFDEYQVFNAYIKWRGHDYIIPIPEAHVERLKKHNIEYCVMVNDILGDFEEVKDRMAERQRNRQKEI